jgi:hypothetical protein
MRHCSKRRCGLRRKRGVLSYAQGRFVAVGGVCMRANLRQKSGRLRHRLGGSVRVLLELQQAHPIGSGAARRQAATNFAGSERGHRERTGPGANGAILDVRHEVVAVAVSRCCAMTTPAVLSAVSYRDRRRGQPRGRKLSAQRSLIRKDGGQGREFCLRLPASVGSGTRIVWVGQLR